MVSEEITMKDLANRLNTSISTISRSLRDHYSISAEMKSKVLKLAKELDFHPNPAALKLLKNKSYVIGVIIPEIAHNYFSLVMSGIEDIAIHEGYNLMFCVSHESAQKEAEAISNFIHAGVDGLLIAPTKETTDYSPFELLKNKKIPFIFFDRYLEGFNVSKVIIDGYKGAYQAVEHLISIGKRNIAHIAGPIDLSNTKQRLSGYKDALRDHNIDFNNELLIHCNLNKGNPELCTTKLLNLSKPPDAIFAYNSYIAFDSIMTVKKAGMKIPEDIAFAGIANEPIISYIEPRLTSIIPPAYQLGQQAANLFFKQTKSKPGVILKPETIILEPEFVIGSSSIK